MSNLTDAITALENNVSTLTSTVAALGVKAGAQSATISDIAARVAKLETSVVVTVPPPTTAKLLFSDDFNTLDLVTPANPNGKWRPDAFWQSLVGGYEDFAGNSYNLNPNAPAPLNLNPFSIVNGELVITCQRIPLTLTAAIRADMDKQGQTQATPKWMGGFLVSNNGFNGPLPKFKYGYFEFVARFPAGAKGMFPALWLYASEGGSDPLGKSAAEIDILEIFGTPNKWSTTLHGATTTNVGTQPQDTNGKHTYAIDWQPTYLRFYYDNVLVYEITGSAATYFNTTMCIIMNYSMDAPWFPASAASDSTTPSTLQMMIDSVKVWNVKP